MNNETSKNILGERLKETRNKMNKSQKELADILDITPASLSAYETGSKNPSLGVLIEISKKCGVSMDWLCGLSEKENNNKTPQKYSDIIEMLFNIGDSLVDLDIETQYNNGFGNDYWSIIIKNYEMQNFLNEWQKMYNLFKNNTIDNELYSLWKEKTLNKYSWTIGEAPF